MVCIEHFSKWCEIIPIKDNNPSTCRDAFVSAVLTRFGSPTEVLTDQGGEFEAEFAQMFNEMLFAIDPVVPPAQRVDWGDEVDCN
jgi:hypothetical protein